MLDYGEHLGDIQWQHQMEQAAQNEDAAMALGMTSQQAQDLLDIYWAHPPLTLFEDLDALGPDPWHETGRPTPTYPPGFYDPAPTRVDVRGGVRTIEQEARDGDRPTEGTYPEDTMPEGAGRRRLKMASGAPLDPLPDQSGRPDQATFYPPMRPYTPYPQQSQANNGPREAFSGHNPMAVPQTVAPQQPAPTAPAPVAPQAFYPTQASRPDQAPQTSLAQNPALPPTFYPPQASRPDQGPQTSLAQNPAQPPTFYRPPAYRPPTGGAPVGYNPQRYRTS